MSFVSLITPMRARVLAKKSEEATASLLATPLVTCV